MSEKVARTISLRVNIEVLEHDERGNIYELQRLLEEKTGLDLGDPELLAIVEGVGDLLESHLRGGSARVGSVSVLDDTGNDLPTEDKPRVDVDTFIRTLLEGSD